jgi:MtrB/PioB family decaheme-associated outer membrane protein
MKSIKNNFHQKTLVLAIASVFGTTVYADQISDAAEFTEPSSSVSVGASMMSGNSKDRSILNQYNGLRKDDTNLLLDLDLVRRDEATGTWMILKGTDIGLDGRELSATYEKQGDWKIGASYGELVHREIRTINTADTGVGTSRPTIVALPVAGSGSDIDLKLKRTAYGLEGAKWIFPSLLFEVNFKSEDKDGARFTGKGYDCASYVCTGSTATQIKNAVLMQAEPVNFNTKQLDMKLSFSNEKLNINGGYYGSFFSNSNGSVNMTVPNQLYGSQGTLATLYPAAAGGTSLQNVLQAPFALPPDNQAHQFYVAGNYGFTKSTKATFKYAYTHATQDDSFSGMGLSGAPAGVSNLGGVVNTTFAQIGISSKPITNLSLTADLRYENKDDKTPKYQYNIENTTLWYNALTSGTKLAGKLEASYRLPYNYRVTAGYNYNKTEREVPTSAAEDLVAGILGSAVRQTNEEQGYRLELSKMMSETLTGSIGYTSSHRRGSDWTSLSTTTTAALLNTYCGGVTCYGQTLPWSSILGLSASSAAVWSMADVNREKLYSVDAAYMINDAWQLTAYASHGKQELNIVRPGSTTGYALNLDDTSDAFGLGLKGQVNSRIDVGANLTVLDDSNKYGINSYLTTSSGPAIPNATQLAQAAIGLPDVDFKMAVLSLYGRYTIDKNSSVRVDFVHQHAKLREWSWGYNGVPFVYADNTTVNLKETQNATFLGARYQYNFK